MDDSSSESPPLSIEGGSEHEYDAYDMEDDREEYDEAAEEDDEDDDDDDESADGLAFEMGGFMEGLRDSPAAEIHFDGPMMSRSSMGVLQIAGGDHSTRNLGEFLQLVAGPGGGTMAHRFFPYLQQHHHHHHQHRFPAMEHAQRVHPALARPSTPPDMPPAAINSHTHLHHSPNFLENPSLDVHFLHGSPLATPPLPGTRAHSPQAQGTHEPSRMAAPNPNGPPRDNPLDDALASLTSLANIINPDDAAPPPPPASDSDNANGPTQSVPALPPAAAAAAVAAATAAATAAVQELQPPAANDNDEIMPQAQARAHSLAQQSSNLSNQVEAFTHQLSALSQAIMERAPPAGTMLQSVLPSQVAAQIEILDGSHMHVHPGFPIPPSAFGRSVSRRSRDRERTSTSSRWSYDPPGNGGDDLPGMFTGETANQRAQSTHTSGRRNPSNPFATVAAESFESVNNLEKDVISRITQLTSDLCKIDKKANEVISDAKKKKEAEEKAKKELEEKKKAEEEKAKEEKKEEEKASTDTTVEPEKKDAASEDLPPVAMQTEEPQSTAQTEDPENNAQPANPEPGAPANDADGDVEVIDVDADANANQEQNAEAGNTQGQAPAAPAANEEFPSVAAARAAAIGISLDAPANEDPNVIQAACDSTGIDPTFLAAIPDDVRAEVFNQLFESMSNAAPAQEGAAGQPVSTLNQDFLIALPPSLRAQVLEAEVEYQARNAPPPNQAGNGNNAAANNNAQGNGPVDQMDNATFLATLQSELREEILITAGEDFIRSLPPHLAAEARTLRERDAANQMHQHHPWAIRDEPGPMMFSRGMYPPGSRRGREARENRREEYGMRWEKIDEYWYRVGPKKENEIKSSLNDQALKSVVRLLKLSNCTHTKSAVFLVLKSACRNSDARKRVLSELLTMITCEKDKHTGATANESQVYATEGTIVRRALELLKDLCKSDTSVAEALVGLPSPPVRSPDSETIESNEPVVDKLLSLSTLTSLLSTPLFLRSNVHLEQLLNVISLVCKAFPSSRPSKIGSGSPRRGRGDSVSTLNNILAHMSHMRDDDDDEFISRPPRRLIEHFEESHMLSDRELSMDEAAERHHILSMNMDEMPYDMPRHFEVRRTSRIVAPASDDSSEGEPEAGAEGEATAEAEQEQQDDSSGNQETNEEETATNAEQEASGNTDEAEGKKKDKDKKKKKKKPEVRIPPEFRVPKLSEEDLNALVVVLRRANCKDQIYEQVSSSLGLLGQLPPNRSVTIAALANSAQDLGLAVKKAYVALKDELGPKAKSNDKDARKKLIISKFAMGTSTSELMLLRLVKTAAALLNMSVKKEKPSSKKSEKPALDPKNLAELRESKDQVFRSLQDVWISLYEVLDLVESELETVSADKKKEGLRRNSRRNEGLARQTRTRNSRKSLTPVLARLSPTIEALFITHSTLIDAEDDKTIPQDVPQSPRPMSPGSPMNTSSMNDTKDAYLDSESSKFRQLGAFLSRHRVPVNALLRVNPTLLETSFKLALKHPQTIDFDNKQAYFRSLIKRRSSEAHASTLRINVRRNYVYTDSHQQLRKKTKDEMKGRLHVQFNGEEGIDAGGVTREWYTIMARQIFDANYALFCRSAAKAATYQPDKRSYINEEHLENFKFVGRFVAKAIFDGQHIDAYFTRAFYKHILGIKPTYRDIEAQDPDYYNSLKWMLENDITGVLDNTMSAEYEEFGQRKVVDLIPNGRNVQVTEENKAEYVKAVTEVRLTRAIDKQIEAFKEGFHELIPLEDCKIFNELELELVMSGLPDIDMADLKANVEYTGYTSSSPQINWFWRCVSQMDQEDLARLVMFVTGTSKVPLEGFSALQGMNGAQKFQIHRVAGDTNRLPSAHTCFNQLDLPEYSSAEVLAERVLKAVRECNVGFGFA